MPRFNILSAILSEMLIQIGRYIRVIQNIQMGCFFWKHGFSRSTTAVSPLCTVSVVVKVTFHAGNTFKLTK